MENTRTRQLTRGMTFGDILAALLATSDYAKETVGKIRETVRRMQELIDGLEKKAGKTGRKIDDMFIPRLERRFGAMGFVFDRSAERALFGNREYPNCYAEIDVFLEDRGRAVAVAVETQPYTDDAGKRGEITANLPDLTEANIDDIMEHIERMKRLRRHFDLTGDHRRLYGAVAAAVFPADILDFAMKQGFYAIVYVEEHIEVREPEGGAKAW